jgi:hypothetical protein
MPFKNVLLSGFHLTGRSSARYVRPGFLSFSRNAKGRPMARLVLVPLDRPEVAALPITLRLRNQLVYFMSPRDTPGIPTLGDDDFWFDSNEVAKWVDEGVFYLVSPLDTDNMTEVELTEEQEALLAWLHSQKVEHVRIEER